ncbi:MAG: alpha-hydroxy acid oxidase [Calothrix sp. MO_167.B42]|nr:alpha-hydroxy acid oxidase [Calothrix sp. MO_167.B42]
MTSIMKPLNLFEYEAQAKNNLSQMAWDYYVSGAGDEITLRNNRNGFESLQLRPRMLVDVSQRNLSTQILGKPQELPILIAPMAFQCLANPAGEIATAKVAGSMGITMVLSTMATKSMEEVAAVEQAGNQWFQLYVHRDRGLTKALVERAYNSGFQALCLTVDAPLLGRRERDARNQFVLPPGMSLANLATWEDREITQKAGESGLFAYFAEQLDPGLTWADVEWLRELSPLPLVIKGILRGDDAVRAVEHGVNGIIVSNHGGRQLDGAIATIDALGEIVTAVENQAEVLMDGGIRRGTDILKALALGAKAVLVGRPILWGLAVAGSQGVQHVIELLRDELDLAMALTGCATLQDIDSSLIKS